MAHFAAREPLVGLVDSEAGYSGAPEITFELAANLAKEDFSGADRRNPKFLQERNDPFCRMTVR